VTVVNSNWTGEHVRRFLGIETRTLYPPVVDAAPGLPWSERTRTFLAVGRISPEKEYERMMTILARVRERVPDVALTIVGTWDRHARRYYNSLAAHARSLGPWIQLRGNLTRDEVRQLMASCRYGLHGMREEHFGMAPAELARAGAIVWVPRGGGQMEIVGNEPKLMYESDADAVAKITATLTNPREEQQLRDLLAGVSEQFSTDNCAAGPRPRQRVQGVTLAATSVGGSGHRFISRRSAESMASSPDVRGDSLRRLPESVADVQYFICSRCT
jgi:glycosyltransferase involved in cell wall biosynthesis